MAENAQLNQQSSDRSLGNGMPEVEWQPSKKNIFVSGYNVAHSVESVPGIIPLSIPLGSRIFSPSLSLSLYVTEA